MNQHIHILLKLLPYFLHIKYIQCHLQHYKYYKLYHNFRKNQIYY